jgi:hypothetical protein
MSLNLIFWQSDILIAIYIDTAAIVLGFLPSTIPIFSKNDT